MVAENPDPLNDVADELALLERLVAPGALIEHHRLGGAAACDLVTQLRSRDV